MKLVSMGDLAQTFALRRQNSSLSAEIAKLTEELASGKTTTPASHMAGDYRYLSDIEHRSKTAQAYEAATLEAKGMATAMQAALGHVQDTSEALAADLLNAGHATQETWNTLSNQAEQQFSTIVSALNTSYAGRSLFAGDMTNTAALTNADEILAELRIAITGVTAYDDIQQSVNDWFMSDTGFGTAAYQGSNHTLTPLKLGEQDTIHLDLRADASEIRSLLADVALAAISHDYADQGFHQDLLKKSGLNLLEEQDSLTGLRADLGFAEERIEEIGVALSAEQLSLQYAREALLGVDAYQTATELENAQFRLEALYTLTARLSGLSLVNYL